MFWQTEEEKQALANIRRERRYIGSLKRDLSDFYDIFWHPTYKEQKDWAFTQIRSIEHELDEIEAGRLGVPEDWHG